ncbi:Type IV secretory pathway, VirD2 components (relaxase) [Bradyrhizobium lablabi]|uniref:Type IV secretory pathway, VirD2 components (Relaxase) n=1 Tax=Bradyrhizobium lablabi TaxID=722472 RepID=A0A1M6NJ36_9BRAD|nr:VirD2 family relaxase/mobilization nuclease [Bradyrhizobium lablabi]SHJ95707.1 Type IV secretory pathway, VirD2 components (relaxase) [Bradyrhizobium lablabi]
MSTRDDDIHIRPGRIRHGNQGARRPKSFVGQVMRAAKRAGHIGESFGHGRAGASRSRFGRGRRAALSLSLRSTSRRVVMKARVVRHHGTRFRSAPLPKHITYLKREGVTRDGAEAKMFDANGDATDEKAFAERCEDDRHHFRFIISPEDAAELDSLRTFTRELMSDVERDLGSKLDWVAVDHWNTDNPHVHVLIRGRGEDGKDLVISRDYISRGFRDRASERVTLELGPRSEHEIRSALEREVEAERWTSLDRALRNIADEGAGLADLRPGASSEDPQLRRLLLGRAAKLERLGLAEQVAPACWTLKSGLEQTLRDLGIRGDIIKTMHRVMTGAGREADMSGFAVHGDDLGDPVRGRLVARGLHDELRGSAYAIVEGVDGRTHHLQFQDIELTGDAAPGAIVEARTYQDANGRNRRSLAVRSDLSLQHQIMAPGATWLDRQLLAREPVVMGGGFGEEVREAMDRRVEHLAGEGLARRQGQRVIFARDLLNTLRKQELSAAAAKISAETGLIYRASAEDEAVAGVYRQRMILSSGRFAMLDDGIGFQLVPWRPALEQQLGRHVSGVTLPGGGVDWSFGRKRGLGL